MSNEQTERKTTEETTPGKPTTEDRRSSKLTTGKWTSIDNDDDDDDEKDDDNAGEEDSGGVLDENSSRRVWGSRRIEFITPGDVNVNSRDRPEDAKPKKKDENGAKEDGKARDEKQRRRTGYRDTIPDVVTTTEPEIRDSLELAHIEVIRKSSVASMRHAPAQAKPTTMSLKDSVSRARQRQSAMTMRVVRPESKLSLEDQGFSAHPHHEPGESILREDSVTLASVASAASKTSSLESQRAVKVDNGRRKSNQQKQQQQQQREWPGHRHHLLHQPQWIIDEEDQQRQIKQQNKKMGTEEGRLRRSTQQSIDSPPPERGPKQPRPVPAQRRKGTLQQQQPPGEPSKARPGNEGERCRKMT